MLLGESQSPLWCPQRFCGVLKDFVMQGLQLSYRVIFGNKWSRNNQKISSDQAPSRKILEQGKYKSHVACHQSQDIYRVGNI
jgi:hypothetical protein